MAFISSGLGFMYYHRSGKGKVITSIFSPGDIVLNPDRFFIVTPPDASLTFIEGASILLLTASDLNVLFEVFEQAKMLIIKTLAGMFNKMRIKDELNRLQGTMKIKHFLRVTRFC